MTILRKLPIVVDTTLRDGVQMPGVHLGFNDRETILSHLSSIGISEIEFGCAPRSEGELQEMCLLAEKHQSIILSVWCRARKEDIDRAASIPGATVHISFPASSRHMKILSTDEREVLTRADRLIRYARVKAPRVTVGAQDATRADPSFLRQLLSTSCSAGAARIRIADTVGIATLQSITTLISSLKHDIPDCPLEFHGHNDFGLAAAITLAAAEAGIDAVSTTVQGVGERAGNTAFEEFITAAMMLYDYDVPFDTRKLALLCMTVAEAFNLPARRNKAIIGTNVFRHESGVHCHGMRRDGKAYQPFDAELVGLRTSFSIGEYSGVSSLLAALESCGITATDGQARKLMECFRK